MLARRSPSTSTQDVTVTEQGEIALLKPCERPSTREINGKTIPLVVNWYRLRCELTGRRVHQYHITIEETRQTRPIKNIDHLRDIFWHCVRLNKGFFGPYNEITFDDNTCAFSLNHWKFSGENCRKFTWDHKKLKKCALLSLMYRISNSISIAEDVAQRTLSATVVKSIVTQRARYVPEPGNIEWNYINRWEPGSGSLYYIPRLDTDPKVYIDAGVRAWLGAYASAKVLHDRSPALSLGLVNRLFYELDMGLLQFYCEVLHETGLHIRGNRNAVEILRGMAMNASQRKKMNSLLEGVRLKTKKALVRGSKNCYRLVERHCTFIKKDNSRNLPWSWSELQYPNLPLCEVGKGLLLPLEVLNLSDRPQRYSKMISERMLTKFIKGVSRPPYQHKQFVEAIFTMLEFDVPSTVNFLNAFKMGVIPKMIQCDGVVLDPPVPIDKERNEVPMTPERAIKRKEINEPPPGEVVFAVFIMGTPQDGKACVPQEQSKQFFEDLVTKCVERGLRVSSGPLRVYYNKTIDLFDRCVEDATKRFSELFGAEQQEKILLMLVIIDRSFFGNNGAIGTNAYGFIKSICDNKYGVASQVVDSSTVVQATSITTKTIYYNIALKINAKLGGINQAVIFDDESRSAEVPQKEAVMYVGIDVTHPSSNSDMDISIACMVANIDLAATRYTSKILVQMRARETVERFDLQFRKLMLSFHEHTGVWPRHIVILRDGVGDSEMIRTASVELHSIRKSWGTLNNGDIDPRPTFTYITIQKRHLTRFYQPTGDEVEEKAYVNVPSGTVVDNVVVSPTLFDFYLASQIGILGTNRPAHYTVIFDEWGLSPDKIYEMCYRLCFLYARCRIPVSLPCPVYYAHRVCEKAREVYKSLLNRNAFDSFGEEDQEKKKSEIEKLLSVSNDYPGMHFV
ncbi:hypothetical protein KIN20_005417 [Parelaphostrongylus tenuis]|uniref:Piwi domain-containing protein n=1 Tax=Parelaphostrongylus tenuis TaxID=148309 RepID=A0AAD5QG09_PARTN|nr:hypothetical protein KIN20_005417 [Parelaphostrongylus tenuis]